MLVNLQRDVQLPGGTTNERGEATHPMRPGLPGEKFPQLHVPDPIIRASCCRCKFLTEGSTPRCGRRVLPVTLSHHHKPFGSARIARGLRAPDLVGAAPRTVARRAPWAREKGFDQDR